ncbi:hypothetical protein CES85_3872 [Ochrobactrum quorumnocens]|uniref:Uncharacterized protein n=1 Tax=Ochrobactrum quorumnocens TaxID=271865 RepID=A0A248U8K1_9HYPH|nr:hypothetical protein CES85_3872 [[Ochrobactrum] quorumnocens]
MTAGAANTEDAATAAIARTDINVAVFMITSHEFPIATCDMT